MKANELNLAKFLGQSKTRYVIPVYQRNYDWKKKHCEQLLDDVIECGVDDKVDAHFIGSIVFIHDDIYTASQITELTIIDGQQRLTSITLIWLVIYRLAQKLDRKELVDDVYETYLVNRRDAEKLKLKSTSRDAEMLRTLIENEGNGQHLDYSRLKENYEYFSSRISEDNLDAIIRGLYKLMFVEISLEREKDNPQRIFESLNSTGLDLSQADLIRNYILMGLRHEDQQRIYSQYWQTIERLARKEDTKESRVSDFIRDFLIFRNKRVPNKREVYQVFKKTFEQQNLEMLEPVLNDLKKYVNYYNKLLNVENEPDPDIRQQLKNINRLEINVSYPFLLQVYDDFAADTLRKHEFIKVLSLIESFVWRRFIVNVASPRLTDIFMRLYEGIDANDYYDSLAKVLVQKKGVQRYPKDSEVYAALRERDVYNTRYRSFLLERLENFQNNEPVRIEDNPSITVEHIFPQNPVEDWRTENSAKDFQELSEVYLHTLANLTLSGNNGSLGNRTFREKRDLPEKGYRDSRLYLNRSLSKTESWGMAELNNRHKSLATRFLQIWPYPNVRVDVLDYEEVNIFDAEDPTGRKLEYAIFLQEKLSCTEIMDLYVTVFQRLFSLDSERFLVTQIAEKVHITNEPTTLRSPKQLDDSYYIESNLSHAHKFARLKYTLEEFELTDDLYVKYASQ